MPETERNPERSSVLQNAERLERKRGKLDREWNTFEKCARHGERLAEEGFVNPYVSSVTSCIKLPAAYFWDTRLGSPTCIEAEHQALYFAMSAGGKTTTK